MFVKPANATLFKPPSIVEPKLKAATPVQSPKPKDILSYTRFSIFLNTHSHPSPAKKTPKSPVVSKPFSDQEYIVEEGPLDLCWICHKYINRGIEFNSRSYHTYCFRCYHCDCVIPEQARFFTSDGKKDDEID